MSPLTTDSQLQIGIEIEFLAPRNTEWEAEHLPGLEPWTHASLSKDACFHRLAVALHDAGLPACYQMKTAPLQRCAARNPLREAAPRGSLVLGRVYRLLGDPARFPRRGGRAGLYRYWLVKGEYGLTDDARYKRWIACELNTPILAEADVVGSTLPDLDTALRALHGASASAPHISPRRCGLHVHLSTTSGSDTLYFAQRVLTLALLLDRVLLAALCDPSRQDLGRPFLSAAVLTARRDLVAPPQTPLPNLPSSARAHLPPGFAAAEARVLSGIWRAETFDELQPILEHNRSDADLLRVAPVLCKQKPTTTQSSEDSTTMTTTVEFRHAQASFSRKFVTSWAGVVLAMGRVALLGVDEYRHALGRLWEAAARTGGGRDAEQTCLATLEVLSETALEAGMLGGGLDLGYWRTRCAQMREGRQLDVDEEGKAVLDEGG